MSKIVLFIFSFTLFLNATTLKIASYNVENLFDMQNNHTEYTQYQPNQHNWTRENLKKKLLNISEVICDINADIIGLQEIENENTLKLLQYTLKRVGCHYQYAVITKKKKLAIQVALLSKIPIEHYKEIDVSKSLVYRNILETKFKVNNTSFYIFVNHWSSKRSGEHKRITSANALVQRLKALPKNSEYIVLGDFNNDYDEFLSTKKTAINHVLKTTGKNNKFFRINDLATNILSHYNLWLELANYKRWSHNFYGNKQALDAMVIPKTLFDGKGLDYVNDSFFVFKKRYLFHKKGYIFRWVYKKNRHKGQGYSDHLPIVAKFSTAVPFIKKPQSSKEGLIDDLYLKTPHYPLLLKQVKVIGIEKNKVSISQSNVKKVIDIFGVEKSLKLGKTYDIMVYACKEYKGEYEVIDFEIEKRYDTLNLKKE
ncbi:MAG: Unknown protein [uncultured Sulfurovum sp.]|uniref:Endonuclease/exonuclease/phosphatase domain-containing protein n=1 Tax=uncultured Sulfurovum sp. TaxID=269237 RepID=A0A6S6ST35_9BACT|nr:MAG: Unknown protein [uncultured Sulfurovum sp.]